MIGAIIFAGYAVSLCAGIATLFILDDRGWADRPASVAALGVFLLGPLVAPVAIVLGVRATGRWLIAGAGEVAEELRGPDGPPPAALPEARVVERDP